MCNTTIIRRKYIHGKPKSNKLSKIQYVPLSQILCWVFMLGFFPFRLALFFQPRLSKSGLYFRSKGNSKIETHKIDEVYSRTFVESI